MTNEISGTKRAKKRSHRAAKNSCPALTAALMPAACNGSDTTSAFYNFSRFLIKNVEHDWGPEGSPLISFDLLRSFPISPEWGLNVAQSGGG